MSDNACRDEYLSIWYIIYASSIQLATNQYNGTVELRRVST